MSASPRSTAVIVRRTLLGIGAGVAALGIIGVAVSAVIAIVFARTIVTPPRKRTADLDILDVSGSTITLSATLDSLTAGRYGLFFDEERGYARIGGILSVTRDTVTREVLDVPQGDLSGHRHARFSGWFYLSPAELGVDFSEVEIETDLGPAPAWLVPADNDDGRWVIQVHGRAVRRQETLRAVPVFHREGFTSLLISYRNDGDAPDSPDVRYGLGATEWRDVEAAIGYALAHGARSIVLMGWSMGGATVLQTLVRSPLSSHVVGVVLESPVVDWVTTLQYQGAAYHLPRPLRESVLGLLSQSWAGPLTGQAAPIDLAGLDLVARAEEISVPVLLFHSDDDGFVPSTASHALAEARPDVVTYEQFHTARHVKLWNYDEERWVSAISRWLRAL